MFIALSHIRGAMSNAHKTVKKNVNERRKLIKFDELPRTFQDAVTVTRKLGVPYLWIDSMCIIQDDIEDCKRESGRMESVFRSAYCTIAANSANSCEDGFLQPDGHPDWLPIKCPAPIPYGHHTYLPCKQGYSLQGTSFCFSEAVQDFPLHVEQAELNKRAWAFQERALSCRTIHFTATQTYWECGSGIASESAGWILENKSPLGSSEFPVCSSRPFWEHQPSAYEYVFSEYSKLGLAPWKDRPSAIAGLESRLGMFYRTVSVYGIFERFFHQSLLWHRARDRITPIPEFESGSVPSWSWMAYEGEIAYKAFCLPDDATRKNDFKFSLVAASQYALEAPLFQISWNDTTGQIMYDGESSTDGQRARVNIKGQKCVVIAQSRGNSYVLLVSPRDNLRQGYRRVGVARVKSGYLSYIDSTVFVV